MDALRVQYEHLERDASPEQRELAIQALARRQYMPMTILSVPNFLSFTKADMLHEYDRIMALRDDSEEIKAVVGISDASQVKQKHLTVLLQQYELLCGLRRNDGDAWATVNELYEDD